MDDVRSDYQHNIGAGYIQDPELLRPRKRVHPLMVHDGSEKWNTVLIRQLACLCTVYESAPPRIHPDMAFQLAVVKEALMQTDSTYAKPSSETIIELTEALARLLSTKDTSQAARELYVATKILADVLYRNIPRKQHEKAVQNLLRLLERAYSCLIWDSIPSNVKARDLLFAQDVYEILLEAHVNSVIKPRTIDFLRSTYRIGMIFRFEKSFSDKYMDDPTSWQLRERFKTRLIKGRTTGSWASKVPVKTRVQKKFIILY